MFRDTLEFILAVARHWSTLMTGGIIIGALDLWQNTGHSVPPFLYWSVAIVALFVAFFRAWRDEHQAKEGVLQKAGPPSRLDRQAISAWLELHNEKKRLQEELELSIESLESLEPEPNPDILPDDPGYWPVTWPGDREYRKVSRKIDRLREDLGLIKEKLKTAPKIPRDEP
jgi:hypothetical protein